MDEGAEVKDVAHEWSQAEGTGEETDDVDVIAMLGEAVWREVKLRCPEIARSLVADFIGGRVQNFKYLVQLLKARETSRAASRKTARRSVASAWGADPEWKDGNRAHGAVRAAAA